MRLNDVCSIKYLGMLHFFVGEVFFTKSSVFPTQAKFTQELLYKSSVIESKRALGPLPVNLKLTANDRWSSLS